MVIALYRPGPIEGGMIDRYIACKHGTLEPEFPHPALEDALREILARKSPKIETAKFDPPVFRGGTGTFPGVDLSNTADLLDRMEDFKPR